MIMARIRLLPWMRPPSRVHPQPTDLIVPQPVEALGGWGSQGSPLAEAAHRVPNQCRDRRDVSVDRVSKDVVPSVDLAHLLAGYVP